MKTQMQTFFESNNIFLIIKMLYNKYFLLSYNKNDFKIGEKEFFKPR